MPSLANADGTMKKPDELKALFSAAGVDVAKPMVFTCGAGVMATYLTVAANEMGLANHSMYDGSWSEYSQRAK